MLEGRRREGDAEGRRQCPMCAVPWFLAIADVVSVVCRQSEAGGAPNFRGPYAHVAPIVQLGLVSRVLAGDGS